MRASGYERLTNDWYQEPPATVDALLDVEVFDGSIYDPACGGGNIPHRCWVRGMTAYGSDLVQRPIFRDDQPPLVMGADVYPAHDFLRDKPFIPARHIISNPPYNVLQEWIDRSLATVPGKVAILGRLAFLEGQARRAWWRTVPLARVWVSSKRLSMPPGGLGIKPKGGTIAYAWFVFDRAHYGPAHVGWL